jgi:hypothetical protein
MCEECRKIDVEIAYYRQRLIEVEDRTAIGLFTLVIEDLESNKVRLHATDK